MPKVAFGDLLPGETPFDTSELLVQGIISRDQLSKVETRNIRKVYAKYYAGQSPPDQAISREIAPFDFEWLKSLHREMYEDVWGWAGRVRLSDYNIGVPWQGITGRLYNLVGDLEYWSTSGMDPLEQAVRLHHQAVWIHPFPNGNGRWARSLANIWLVRAGQPWVRWPEQLIGSVSPIREQYLVALKAADGGDLEPLIAMHRTYLDTD